MHNKVALIFYGKGSHTLSTRVTGLVIKESDHA